jgi:bifunctional DNA-binding transcriptional regulator/antitoxin component of YhaV-PrlF toxin-antitoxin module
MMRITVDEQGKLALPPSILERLNLAAEREFEVEIADGAVVLKPVVGSSVLEMRGSVLVHCGEALEETDVLRQVREDRLQSFWPV